MWIIWISHQKYVLKCFTRRPPTFVLKGIMARRPALFLDDGGKEVKLKLLFIIHLILIY